jgi:hypothetical protein
VAAVTAHSAVFVAAADSFALPSKKKTPGGKPRAPCSVSPKRTDTLARSWRPPTATSKIPQEGRGARGDLCARGGLSRCARQNRLASVVPTSSERLRHRPYSAAAPLTCCARGAHTSAGLQIDRGSRRADKRREQGCLGRPRRAETQGGRGTVRVAALTRS